MLSDRSWQAPDAARVLIDTSIWIYHFEQNPEYARAAAQVIERLEDGKFRGIASELTLLELTVRPLQLGRQECRGRL
jgi:predicted nucleic acid-binding protein